MFRFLLFSGMKLRHAAPFACALGLVCSAPALAGQAALQAPFVIGNESLPAAIHGVPLVAPADVPERTGFSMLFDWTNDYTASTRETESIVLDVETQRYTLAGVLPLGQADNGGRGGQWALEVALPLIHHGSGVLDSSIDTWHDWTGLPDGNRDAVPRDRIRVRATFREPGSDPAAMPDPAFSLDESVTGVGDLRIALARSVAVGSARGALRIAAKLPTGDAEDFTGSGATTVSANLDLAGTGGLLPWSDSQRWFAFGGFGAAWIGEGDVLPELQRSSALTGNIGIGAGLHPRATAKIQLFGHSALYDNTDLPQLSQPAVLLAVGGSWQANPRTVLDVALVENPQPRSAPDVAFHLSIRIAP